MMVSMAVVPATSTWHCRHHWRAALQQQQQLAMVKPCVVTVQQLLQAVHLTLVWVRLLLLLALAACCCWTQRMLLMT
jgi:hypothetical protein